MKLAFYMMFKYTKGMIDEIKRAFPKRGGNKFEMHW